MDNVYTFLGLAFMTDRQSNTRPTDIAARKTNKTGIAMRAADKAAWKRSGWKPTDRLKRRAIIAAATMAASERAPRRVASIGSSNDLCRINKNNTDDKAQLNAEAITVPMGPTHMTRSTVRVRFRARLIIT